MNKKLSVLILALAAILPGCAQVPPATTHSVTLTWTAPASNSVWTGCTTTAPCVYAVYRCTGSATTCGTLSSTAWSEITTPSTRPSALTYVDIGVTGGTSYTYTVETVQLNTNSSPSNTTTALVPQTPGSPTLGSPTSAKLNKSRPTMHTQKTEVASITNLHVAGQD